MKVEYVEPFVEAASSVLAGISGSGAKTGIPGLSGATFVTACVNITARVDGSLRGNIVYSMSTQTARKLSGLISGVETHEFGRQMGRVLVGLGHRLGEQSRKLLSDRGLDCTVGSPIVFQGLNVEFSAMTPALVVPIETSAGQVEISVAVDDDQQD